MERYWQNVRGAVTAPVRPLPEFLARWGGESEFEEATYWRVYSDKELEQAGALIV